MKMTIELNEFWMDGGNLSQALQKSIKKSVVTQVEQNLRETIEELLTNKISKEVEKKLSVMLDKIITEVISTQKINAKKAGISYPAKDMMTITEFIQAKFEHDSGWNSAQENIKKIAKNFGDEMKGRYDLLFASQLVAKMTDNGLISKEAAQLLLSDKKTPGTE